MSEIIEIEKIDNDTQQVKYEDGNVKLIPVIKIESREKALEICTKYTKAELLKPDSFERLGSFLSKNSYQYLRNYEIEDYLDRISGKIGYKINELCPFNGFMWFK